MVLGARGSFRNLVPHSMKKHYLLSLALFCSPFLSAQHWCSTDQKNETIYSDPANALRMHEQMMRAAKGLLVSADRATSFTIPCVVHIIHDGGAGNISYDQILDGIAVMNEDFQKLNADTISIRNTAEAPFSPLAANMNIEFKLAKLDPDGNCTNGVTRTFAPSLADNANDNCKSSANGGMDGWPSDKYINIWVVNSIENSGTGIIIGYAYFPYSAPGPEHGILYRHDYFGTIGTSTSDGEAMSHEMGHILGLRHTFDGGCHSDDCDANGDYCCDTPPAAGDTYGCDPIENTCSDIPTGDLFGFDAYDQYENWMSYNSCQSMFSQDQKDIVYANLGSIDFLENLVSPANITATGVNLPDVLCTADFTSDKTTVCAGGIVNFTDFSYFNVTGWTWTFEGGTPGSSTVQNPVVSYATPGVYDVTLEVTDGVSTESVTLTDYILVLSDPGDPLPYKEHFESLPVFPDNDRFVVNSGGGGATWAITDGAAYGGDHSCWVNNYLSFNTGNHELISGTIDLSIVPPGEEMIFYFNYAYNKFLSTDVEALRVYISDDCGETWTLRLNLDGDELGTDANFFPFTPEAADWKIAYVDNVNTPFFESDFRYKFVFESSGGNNLYIDNINIYPDFMTGTALNEMPVSLSAYPVPSSDNVTVKLFAAAGKNYQVVLSNALGQNVGTIFSGQTTSFSSTWQYDISSLTSGVYFLRVESEGEVNTIKLIKE